jgi:hypothetical protein
MDVPGRAIALAGALIVILGAAELSPVMAGASSRSTTTVAKNAPVPKVEKIQIQKPSVPAIVALRADSCTYIPKTHQVVAGGAITWVPAGGGGAVGTVTAKWSAPAVKRHGHQKAEPAFSVSAMSLQLFSGLFSLTQTAPVKPKHCAFALSFAPPTASSVVTYLQAKGLPISGLIAYDASTDPNHLLGRPNGYLSKVAWQDTRIPQTYQADSPGAVEWGGGIEVYSTAQGAQNRASYMSSIEQADPIVGTEYDYVLGPIVLRISGTFTPTTAQTYGTALTGSTLFVPQPPGSTTTTTAP